MKKNEAFGFNYIDGGLQIPIVYMNKNGTFKPSENDIVFYTDMTNDEVLEMAIKIANDFYNELDRFTHRKYEIVTMIFYNFMYVKDGSVKKNESITTRDVFELNESVGLIIDEYLERIQ